MQQRQREGGSLSRACLGDAHDVATLLANRDGLALDGGGLLVTGSLNTLQDKGDKEEMRRKRLWVSE